MRNKIIGQDAVEKLQLHQVETGEESVLDVGGIFMSVGIKPSTEVFKKLLFLDESSQIITNEMMEANVPGIFAAGDVRHNSGRQVITAAGDGATAAIFAEKYITEHS